MQVPSSCQYQWLKANHHSNVNIFFVAFFKGSKLATYMNRHNFQQQQQPSYNVPELNKGLGSLNLDSNTIKKLTVSGIREFVPQPNSSQSGSFGGAGGGGGGNSAASQMRLSGNGSNSSFSGSNFGSDRLNPTSAIMTNSPRQSPTPASMGIVPAASAAASANEASSIAIYNEGGTTYFYSGDEMVRMPKDSFTIGSKACPIGWSSAISFAKLG